MDRETLAASVTGTAAQLRLQLSDITAASQMLEQTTSGDRARAYLAVLNQGICRMLRTVGQMELLNRLTEEDEIRVFPVPTDLGVWTRELAEHARGILLGARVSLEYRGPKVLMATVDQGLVQQMLLELICVAAQPGGEVSLSLAKQEDTACFTAQAHRFRQRIWSNCFFPGKRLCRAVGGYPWPDKSRSCMGEVWSRAP